MIKRISKFYNAYSDILVSKLIEPYLVIIPNDTANWKHFFFRLNRCIAYLVHFQCDGHNEIQNNLTLVRSN